MKHRLLVFRTPRRKQPYLMPQMYQYHPLLSKQKTIEEPRAAQPAAERAALTAPLVLSCLVPLFSSFVLNPNHNAPAQAPAKDKRGHQI